MQQNNSWRWLSSARWKRVEGHDWVALVLFPKKEKTRREDRRESRVCAGGSPRLRSQGDALPEAACDPRLRRSPTEASTCAADSGPGLPGLASAPTCCACAEASGVLERLSRARPVPVPCPDAPPAPRRGKRELPGAGSDPCPRHRRGPLLMCSAHPTMQRWATEDPVSPRLPPTMRLDLLLPFWGLSPPLAPSRSHVT